MNTDPEVLRHLNGLTEAGHLMMARIEVLENELKQMPQLVVLIDSMSTHQAGLHEELIAQRGRELYMCSDEIIWHRDGDRMIPLTDEGEHVDPRSMRARVSRGVASLQNMTRHDRFPTMKQLQDLQHPTPLKPVTELDVVKRYVRKLEARLSELEG